MNDTVKFMFIGLVQIAMYDYDMYVKVAMTTSIINEDMMMIMIHEWNEPSCLYR